MKTLAEVRQEYTASLGEETKDINSKVRINGAKIYLRQILDQFEGDIKEAVTVAVGASAKSGYISRVSPKKLAVDELVEAGSMTDLEAFQKLDKGPAEMRDVIRCGIRDYEAEDRVWISFEDKTYSVLHVGSEMPEGWSGPMPKSNDVDEDL